MSAAQIAVELDALAERVRRMRGIGRNGDMDPFFLDRSQAAHDARCLAEWTRTGKRPAEYKLAGERGAEDERRARYSDHRGARGR